MKQIWAIMHCSHAWATGRVVTEHYGLLYTRDFSGSLGAPPFSGVRHASIPWGTAGPTKTGAALADARAMPCNLKLNLC